MEIFGQSIYYSMTNWLISIFITYALFNQTMHLNSVVQKKNSVNNNLTTVSTKLQAKAALAKTFTKQNNYNTNVCFFIDMSIVSNQKRFFVYDLVNDSIITKGLVAHGSCNNIYLRNAQFSNTPESGCTAYGKYKIGNSYKGKFGNAFKLHGLDSSNSKAYERNIVLHAYSCMPDEETDYLVCNSLGCPMVSYKFLSTISAYINNSKKPILLWIYS